MTTEMTSVAAPAVRQPDFLWRDGSLVPWAEALVHVNSVGHASVSGVFEGIKAHWNVEQNRLWVFRLEDHMHRFAESMRLVSLNSAFGPDALVTATLELLRANRYRADTYIRPWTFVRGVIRELIAPPNASTETVIDTWPFQSQMLTRRGCTAFISSWIRNGDDTVPTRAKAFANYHNGRMGLIEARARGCDWPIFLNARGRITEAPGACVVAVQGDTLLTPRLVDGVLAGITRDTILALAREELAMSIEEVPMVRSDLLLADEVFFVGTGWEILPVLEIDGAPVGSGRVGRRTLEVEHLYHDLVRGVSPAHRSWLTEIA